MKKLILLFFIYFITIVPQEIGPQREIYFRQLNFPDNFSVSITINAISVIYCRNRENRELGLICSICYLSRIVSISKTVESGFNICFEDSTIPVGYPYFGYSLYEFTNSHSNAYFYLDLRDCNYAPTGIYLSTDLCFAYDNNEQKFKRKNNGCGSDYIDIQNGELIQIWKIQNFAPSQPYVPKTTCFQNLNFWNNSLALVETEDNHPWLIIGSYPIGNIYNSLEYFIYRKVGNNSSFVKIATLPSTTLSYIDESISISHILGGTPVYY